MAQSDIKPVKFQKIDTTQAETNLTNVNDSIAKFEKSTFAGFKNGSSSGGDIIELENKGNAAINSAWSLKYDISDNRAFISSEIGTAEGIQEEARNNFVVTSEELTSALGNLETQKTEGQASIDAASQEVERASSEQATGNEEVQKDNENADNNVNQQQKIVENGVSTQNKEKEELTKAVNCTNQAEAAKLGAEKTVTSLQGSIKQEEGIANQASIRHQNFNVAQYEKELIAKGEPESKARAEANKIEKQLLDNEREAKAVVKQLRQKLKTAENELKAAKKKLDEAKKAQDKAAEAANLNKEDVEKARVKLKEAKVQRDFTKSMGQQRLENLEKRVDEAIKNKNDAESTAERAKTWAEKKAKEVQESVDEASSAYDSAIEKADTVKEKAQAMEAYHQSIESSLIPALNSRGNRALSLYGTFSSKAGTAQETQADSKDKSEKTKYAALNGETFKDTCRRLGIDEKDMKKIIEANTGKGLALGTKPGDNPRYFMAGREIIIPDDLKNSIKKEQLMSDSDIKKQGDDWKEVNDIINQYDISKQQDLRNNFYNTNKKVNLSKNNHTQNLANKTPVNTEDPTGNLRGDSAPNASQNLKKIQPEPEGSPAVQLANKDLKGSGKGKTKGKEAIIFSRMESMKDSSQVKIDKLYEKFKKTNQSETKENFEAFVRKELENNNKVDEQVIQHIVNQKFS